MSLFFKLGTEVKQRTFSDWHIQGVPCQSYTQSISSSQSVLFVCWICFGTCWPLIDMGAGAGKTLLWCGANNALSVTLPQMFGPRAYTGFIVVQKPGRFLSCSHSLPSRFISVIQTALNKNDRPHLYLDPQIIVQLSAKASDLLVCQQKIFRLSFRWADSKPSERNVWRRMCGSEVLLLLHSQSQH